MLYSPVSASDVLGLFAIPKSVYTTSTGAELQCYSLLQHDEKLKQTIISEISAFRSRLKSEDSVIHADLRYDQIVVDESGQVCLIDFEEFGLGEKTRDLAGIVGSILFESGLETFQCESTETADSRDIDYEIRQRGASNFEKALGRCAHFLEEYQTFSQSCLDIAYLAFLTGVFIIRRVLARADFSYKLSGIDKALLGIGRGLIVNPDRLKI